MPRETESELHEIVGDSPVLKSVLRKAIEAADLMEWTHPG
jgi:hypothetical protein